MAELRVFVAEDEGPARRKLIRFLQAENDIVIVGEAEDGPQAVAGIESTRPDLVFLDIQMPGIDGFGVVRDLALDPRPAIVFITAYDQYALQAYGVQALDYLLKPYDLPRLQQVLQRIRKLLHKPDAPPGQRIRRLLIREEERAFFLPVEQIDWVESARNYVNLHARGRTHLIRSSLDALHQRLDPNQFVRISRSHVVRIDSIQELQSWFHGDYKVVLTDGTTLTWSRRYREAAEHLLGSV